MHVLAQPNWPQTNYQTSYGDRLPRELQFSPRKMLKKMSKQDTFKNTKSSLTRLIAGEDEAGLFMLRFSGVASSKWAGLFLKGGESALLKSSEALPIESPLLLLGLACLRLGPDPGGPGLALALAELAEHLSSADLRASGSCAVKDMGLDWSEVDKRGTLEAGSSPVEGGYRAGLGL